MDTCSFSGCGRMAVCKGYCQRHYYYQKRHGLVEGAVCSVEGCGQPLYGNGLCNMHNLRSRRHGDTQTRKRAANNEVCTRPCAVEGCDRTGRARFADAIYCDLHLARMKRHGDPHAKKRAANGEYVGCKVEGCERPHCGYGYCSLHYQQAKRGGAIPGKACAAIGCDAAALCKGYCSAHYQRFKKHGSPEAKLKGGVKKGTKLLSACSFEGCEKTAVAQGLCRRHYLK